MNETLKSRLPKKVVFTLERRFEWVPCGKCDNGVHKAIVEGQEFLRSCECNEDVEVWRVKETEVVQIADKWVTMWFNQTRWIVDDNILFFSTKDEALDHLKSKNRTIIDS